MSWFCCIPKGADAPTGSGQGEEEGQHIEFRPDDDGLFTAFSCCVDETDVVEPAGVHKGSHKDAGQFSLKRFWRCSSFLSRSINEFCSHRDSGKGLVTEVQSDPWLVSATSLQNKKIIQKNILIIIIK